MAEPSRVAGVAARLVRSMWLDVLCVVTLGLACAVHLSSLEQVLDLPPWDEADYLRIGVAYPAVKLPDPEWGPLYALWYAALSKFVQGPVQLFYGSYRLLIALPCFAIYACVRRFGGSPLVALAGGTAFLLAFAPHVIPRSSMLALLIVALVVALFARVRRFAWFACALSVALLVASLARPELFVSFVLAAVALWAAVAWRARRNRRKWLRSGPPLAVWSVAVVALLVVGGNPMSDRSNRRRYAFCQHFALGEVTRSRLPLDPWGQCEEVLAQTFGVAQTVGGAALQNPKAFAAHVVDNLAAYPAASVRIFLGEYGNGHVAAGGWTPIRQVHLVALLALGAAAGLGMWRARRAGRWRRALTQRTRRAALVAACVLVPTAASSVLIWPREHYLVLQGVALCLLFVAVLSALQPAASQRWSTVHVVASIAWVVLVASRIPALELRPVPYAPLQNRRVIEAITAASAADPARAGMHILEAQGGYDAYLGPSFRRISPGDVRPQESFTEFLARTRVAAIVLEDVLLNHHRLEKTPEFTAFIRSPEAFGFKVAEVPGTNRRIAYLDRTRPGRAARTPAPIGARR